ncbi:N-acetylglucosamine-6-phosphate deacetylase [Paenibacillus thalictri]|uniref:N-acetylglucosamine-6-phosphate deacetylase n=1 Tax=Paenibacillus thalictri TaxID=2527873 RepID=A0A4Q9DG82_9BACL|nr:N-acetylglucosamine-6-phosphate deacetylase [Paenibacillus thalictri]TBL69670.1 N-acetylglucosamine-6-phosphate deacetylase [Paenibacillus thalictri]
MDQAKTPGQVYGKLIGSGVQAAISMNNGLITTVAPVEPEQLNTGTEELWIAPGLVDLQVNGFGGYDVNLAGVPMEDRVEAIKNMTHELLKMGTTSFCPTIITAGYEQIMDSMTAVRLACESDPLVDRCVLGIHLEGPYLSGEDGPRGAHPKEHIKDPDWQEFLHWNEAAGGKIRMVTLAPERAGAVQMIRKLVSSGILVCIGHTAATHDQITAAVDAGAAMSTHLGNGAHPLLPRHPNYIWSQLAEDRLICGIIADGHHLHPSVVKVMARAKQGRIVLVSDAVHLAGMPPGKYTTHVGGEVELLPSGRLQTSANPLLLAGSAASLLDCVAGYSQFTGAELSEAFTLASAKPAELIGEPQLGTIATNRWADLILFAITPETRKIEVRAVIKRGETVYSTSTR